MNPSSYYHRSEVSNSDLTALKEMLHPRMIYGDRERAFRFGSLVDALITETERVNFLMMMVDEEVYHEDEWAMGLEMKRALEAEAKRDAFLQKVLHTAETQTVMYNRRQRFEYLDFPFHLDTRCKWDWFLQGAGFGGDLKTTAAATEKQFVEAIDLFDWDRSRAWYMDIARSDNDFIYAISKKNFRVFKHFITRDDATYRRGKEKYEELAFQYWLLHPQQPTTL